MNSQTDFGNNTRYKIALKTNEVGQCGAIQLLNKLYKGYYLYFESWHILGKVKFRNSIEILKSEIDQV